MIHGRVTRVLWFFGFFKVPNVTVDRPVSLSVLSSFVVRRRRTMVRGREQKVSTY